MTTHHRQGTALAAAGICAALALGACGASGGSGDDAAASGGRPSRQDFRKAATEFAQCMRKNGVDMPDPKPGSGGIAIGGPGSGVDPGAPVFQGAQKKCGKILRSIRPPTLSKERRAEFRKSALKFAKCMRGEGIDFPDPTFGGGGAQFRIRGGRGDPNDPATSAAQKKCGRLLPRRPGG